MTLEVFIFFKISIRFRKLYKLFRNDKENIKKIHPKEDINIIEAKWAYGEIKFIYK